MKKSPLKLYWQYEKEGVLLAENVLGSEKNDDYINRRPDDRYLDHVVKNSNDGKIPKQKGA
jgi:hypothetical protein